MNTHVFQNVGENLKNFQLSDKRQRDYFHSKVFRPAGFLLMLKAFKNSKHEETLDNLRNIEKELWLPVVPRQPKHLAIAVLGSAQAHVGVTEGKIETNGVAVDLHQL